MALDMALGDTLVFDVSFDYQGPAYDGAFIRASIGIRAAGFFDEKNYAQKTLVIPATSSLKTYGVSLPVVLRSPVKPGTGYDLEVKLGGIPGADLFWQLNDAVNIISELPEAEFRDLTVAIKKG